MPNDGYQIKRAELMLLNWRAAYGLYLINACRAADLQSEATGKFVEAVVMSEREFRLMRNTLLRRKERLS